MNMNNKFSTRANIILALEKINNGTSSSALLDELLSHIKDNEKAFAHELLFGTLRHWFAINRIGESLIKTPPTDIAIICALNMGIYELLFMNTPDYAVINETLNAIKSLNKNYGVGLINAILRKVADNKEKFIKKINKNHSLPNWLAKQMKIDWAEFYEMLGQTLRNSAPIFLRPNAKFVNVSEYSQILTENNIAHEMVKIGFDNSECIQLNDNIKIPNLPNFKDGYFSVQDKNAQICGYLLADLIKSHNELNNKELNILDACSAPGGKTAHLLEYLIKDNKKFHLTALDNDEKRLSVVTYNLNRLKLLTDKTKIICDDATTYKADNKFDIVILDAPCTATGVIRRHPDIGLLRTENDVVQTAKLQADILTNLWQSVQENGYLLYITCSLLKAENELQMNEFLNKNNNAKAVEFNLNLPNQIKREIGIQCLPLNETDGDGFYYCLLQKSS